MTPNSAPTLDEKLAILTQIALRLFEMEDDDEEDGRVHIELVFHRGDIYHPNPIWSCRIRYGWLDDSEEKPEPVFLTDYCNGTGATPSDAVDSCSKMSIDFIRRRLAADGEFLAP